MTTSERGTAGPGERAGGDALAADLEDGLRVDVAIIGAGFAGAATAFHLASRGVERIALIERERSPGLHSSGRNAAMIRQVTSDPLLTAMGKAGAEFLRDVDRRVRAAGEAPILRRSGSLLLASGKEVAALERDAACAREIGIEVECLDRAAAVERYPVLEGAPFELACRCATDGVVDLSRLLAWYIDGARSRGARILLGRGATEILTAGGRTAAVRLGNRTIESPVVVDAGGGWAEELAALAGAAPMPLRPTRRHIFVTAPLEWVSPEWPFIWDLSAEVYFRPEDGALMLSGCDVGDPGPALESDGVREEIRAEVLRKARERFPALGELPVERGWSGIRTLTPDGRFVIGPDPRLEGFFWVAGLGGHGVTASGPVGELAASLVLDRAARDRGNPHSPSRFAGASAGG